MNHITLIGRLTKEPEMSFVGENKSLCRTRYTIAVDRRFTKDKTDFIPIVALGKAGEFAGTYFQKGKRVAIEGRLQVDNYKDKDGNNRVAYSIIAENQEFADAPTKSPTKEEVENQAMAGFTEQVPDDVVEAIVSMGQNEPQNETN